MSLKVPIPDKKKKGKKGPEETREEKDDGPRDAKKSKREDATDVSAKAEEEENPFDEMDDEVPSDSDDSGGEEEDFNSEDEERALSKLEAMLGGSDEESGDEDMKAKYQALLGEMSDGDTADDGSNSDEEDDEMEDLDEKDDGMDSDRQRRMLAADVSLSPSPPPASRKAKEARAKKPTGRPGQTTFLPSLMGGYISGSESEASDIDVAPPKKRLGQKQRQAIWEKKYGSQANHVKNQSQQKQKARDNGWDMRRGAVGGEDDRAGNNKPWKRGVSNPLARQGRERSGEERRPQATSEQRRPPPKKDNDGPLHPSWEARKKAKEAQTTAAFQGTKITF